MCYKLRVLIKPDFLAQKDSKYLLALLRQSKLNRWFYFDNHNLRRDIISKTIISKKEVWYGSDENKEV